MDQTRVRYLSETERQLVKRCKAGKMFQPSIGDLSVFKREAVSARQYRNSVREVSVGSRAGKNIVVVQGANAVVPLHVLPMGPATGNSEAFCYRLDCSRLQHGHFERWQRFCQGGDAFFGDAGRVQDKAAQ